ncbi:hypothetical protein ASE93_01700 [Serratia sp. Leaf50]|nr:hypothetical protein ASE93_01700 [Serratia sp. Leaf50]
MLTLRLIFIPCLFVLSGCRLLSPRAEYIPDNEVLKVATVGVPYFLKINMLGGRVIGSKEKKVGFVTPSDRGIFLRNCKLPDSVITEDTRDLRDFNCAEVYGTPTKPGVIKITIGGGMYGHMFAPAKDFIKDYTLNVVNP